MTRLRATGLRMPHLPRPGQWSPSYPPGKLLAVRRAQELARLPPFATCTPRELRFIARWGDLITVERGQVLARRDHSDWWMLVVLSGRVALRDDNGPVDDLSVGEQFGAEAILGLRPQRCTATAAEPSVLFVLGPRYVLSLLSVSERFRRGLFPGVAAADYDAFAKRLYDEGQTEWRRLAGEHRGIVAKAVPRQRPRKPTADRLPGRPLTLAEAVHVLAALPPPPETVAVGPAVRLSRRWWLGLAAGLVAILAGVLFGYHPPRLVLSSGRPIDVAADIRISGVRTYPPTGHYLLLWVRASQPSLAGLLTAWVERRPTVAYDGHDEADVRATGRAEYLDSQHRAITLALAAAGLDPRAVTVHIRDRGFSGPSAGLVYALALDDMLTPGDLSGGRVIGVTGAIGPAGRVEPIGWLLLKESGATHGHATLLVVPAGQIAGLAGWPGTACGVTNLHDALRALLDTREDNGCMTRKTLARR